MIEVIRQKGQASEVFAVVSAQGYFAIFDGPNARERAQACADILRFVSKEEANAFPR